MYLHEPPSFLSVLRDTMEKYLAKPLFPASTSSSSLSLPLLFPSFNAGARLQAELKHPPRKRDETSSFACFNDPSFFFQA